MEIDKPEYPPLFPAGFVDIVDTTALPTLFLEGFANPARRQYLIERLAAFLNWISGAVPIEWEVWIDGSFCTEKEEPDDVDLALFFSSAEMDALPEESRSVVEMLASGYGPHMLRLRYNCDCYFLPRENDENRSYWRGWFGFTRSEEPKGIPRLWLNRPA